MKTEVNFLLLLLLFFFISINESISQVNKFSIGLSSDYERTFVKLLTKEAIQSYEEKAGEAGMAYRFNVHLKYRLNNNWDIISGLQYAKGDFNIETDGVSWASDFNTIFGSTKYNETTTFQNLEIPILVTYNIKLPKGYIPFAIGSSFNWRLKTETRSRFRSGDGTEGMNVFIDKEGINKVNASLIIQFGYKYPLNESLHVGINPTFNYRLIKEDISISFTPSHLLSYGINVGLELSL